jgi:DNA-binding MarR family transcriptional regulator
MDQFSNISVGITSKEIAELLEQVFYQTYRQNFADGLRPSQWAALRYFANAEPQDRTVSGFAGYHGTTTGSASQTIHALVKRGFLARVQAFGDRRSHRLDPTDDGHALLRNDPGHNVRQAIEMLNDAQRRDLNDVLRQLSDHLTR